MVDDRNRYYQPPYGADRDPQDYGRDYGSGRDYGNSSARDYRSAGELGDESRNFRQGGTGYGGYGRDDRGSWRGSSGSGGSWAGQERSQGHWDRGQSSWDHDDGYRGGQGRSGYGRGDYRESGRYGRDNRDDYRRNRDQGRGGQAPRGYDYEDRNFFARAGDEVRSWFGDDEAERRREADQRFDERMGRYHSDSDYSSWRRDQMDELDRDYHEYRQENASRFADEFKSWRTNRQSQRQQLSSVREHMDVVGSDGEHVGTVDKVRGDRVILTKTDTDAGGRHHSFSSGWIKSVDTKVTLSKTAEEAKRHWHDEDRSGAFFGSNEAEGRETGRNADGSVNLNKSFSGTY